MKKSAPEEIRCGYQEILPGIYLGVPIDKYHLVGGYCKSNLSDIANYGISMMEYRKSNPEYSDAMLKGSMFHDLCLLPDTYHETYLVGPTVKRNTKAWKKYQEDNPDKVLVTSGMSDDVHRMRDSLMENPSIRPILEADTILRETSLWVPDPGTGLLTKARPDIIVDGVIYDLKSSIAPWVDAFDYSVKKYDYDMQSAFYQDACAWNGMQIDDFKFLVVGSKPPWLTAIYNLSEERVAYGRERYRYALDELERYFMSDDQWDGLPYAREVVTL